MQQPNFLWMVAVEPTTPNSHGLFWNGPLKTPSVSELVKVLVLSITRKRLTDSLPKLSHITLGNRAAEKRWHRMN